MQRPKSPKSKIKIRRRWRINPRTKVKSSAKRYSRTKHKQEVHKIVETTNGKGT